MKILKNLKTAQLINMTPKQRAVQICLYLFGVIFLPLGSVMTIKADLGAGAGDAMNFSVSDVLGINISVAIFITSFAVLLVAAVVRRSFPRIATYLTSFIIGLVTDFWNGVFDGVTGGYNARGICLFIFGTVILALAIAAYITSLFPPNPFDDILSACSEQGISLLLSKLTLDGSCLIIAFLLAGTTFTGGHVGVGTVIITIVLGPLISFIQKYIKRIFNL